MAGAAATVPENRAGDKQRRNREADMDWDDVRPPPQKAPTLGEDLTRMGVADLEARIKALETEIARVRTELETKRKHEAAADALFKR